MNAIPMALFHRMPLGNHSVILPILVLHMLSFYLRLTDITAHYNSWNLTDEVLGTARNCDMLQKDYFFAGIFAGSKSNIILDRFEPRNE
jgi:hypothetical protein